jgi:hypothetical protein
MFIGDAKVSSWEQMGRRFKEKIQRLPTLVHLSADSMLSNILQDTPWNVLFPWQPGTM